MRILLLLTLAIILVSLVPIKVSQAQDPENACFEGGAMAGKCNTDWEWVCGYYLAQWTNAGGWQNPNNIPFPSWCNPQSLLPPTPAPVIVDQASGAIFPIGFCVGIPVSSQSVSFNGSYFIQGPFTYYNGTVNCDTTPSTQYSGTYVYAPAPFDPLTLCKSAFGTLVSTSLKVADSDIYQCF